MSDFYRTLRPLQVIRLNLKRPIQLDWRFSINFRSYSKLSIKPALNLEVGYSHEKAFYLNKLCALIYKDENIIKATLSESYDFNEVLYSSWSTASRQVRPLTRYHLLNVAYTFLRAKKTVVDLQFTQLITTEESTKKPILVFAFRGSREPEDWLTNLRAKLAPFVTNRDVHVHSGFQDVLKKFLRGIQRRPILLGKNHYHLSKEDIPELFQNCKIILTGHSLGGAIATLLGCYLHDLGVGEDQLDVYTFGAPPVGSLAFAKHYHGRFPLYRVVNTLDPVPMLARVTHLNHLGELIALPSNEGELHDSSCYHDNLLDALQEEI